MKQGDRILIQLLTFDYDQFKTTPKVNVMLRHITPHQSKQSINYIFLDVSFIGSENESISRMVALSLTCIYCVHLSDSAPYFYNGVTL